MNAAAPFTISQPAVAQTEARLGGAQPPNVLN